MKNTNSMKRFVVRSLLKRSVSVFMLLGASFAFSADFNMDFQRGYQERMAENRFSAQKYPEAREAFEKLAATAKDPLEKNLWQARIAASVGLQKDKLAEGLAGSKRPSPPTDRALTIKYMTVVSPAMPASPWATRS